MTVNDDIYTCDFCGGTFGEFHTSTGNHFACEEIAALRAENEQLKEVLSIYANRANWSVVNAGHGYGGYKIVTWTVDETGYERARETLAELDRQP